MVEDAEEGPNDNDSNYHASEEGKGESFDEATYTSLDLSSSPR